ncbi:MAG: hypothetical protein Q4G03_07475 [Planctomycetia bacterium]|nr:hypothetical protein [Planctomycetia bacterium]
MPRTNRARALLLALFLLLTTSQILCAQSPNAWNPAQSDQWVAVDQLGRALPANADVGDIRPDKYIACFYFLWNGRHGDAGPYDITKILAEHPEAKDDPDSPLWGKLYAPHHWGESIFGYYVGEDESVLRKHAQMLGDAGVDVICFDVTNQLTYPESYRPLFKVFSEMQQAGNKVPKVAFLCPFGSPNKVVRELWREVYSQNFYPDVWFYWKGKPLILADPDYLSPALRLTSQNCVPIEIGKGDVLAQTFRAKSQFNSVNVCAPTWNDTNSALSITLLDADGNVVLKVDSYDVVDNLGFELPLEKPAPTGEYTIELRNVGQGRVGCWSRNVAGDDYTAAANQTHKVAAIDWLGATKNGQKLASVLMTSVSLYDEELDNILNFFTFRPSQPDYFIGPRKPNQWSWLEAYPQHVFYNDQGEPEEVGVGVAQNATDGKLSVMSNPRAYGRSYHNGEEPAPEDCNYFGMNFQEQWDRALELDPEIIFVTGWNEWIAGRFDINAPFHAPTPVTFVDQYNEEFSRDCEPMVGGHVDDYYYQMIANIRRFKGVSKQEPSQTAAITLDGAFDDWTAVRPIFFDTACDPVHRDCRGWGKGMRYFNQTGRNDILETRVSYDNANVYFYLKVADALQGDLKSDNWLALLLNTDDDVSTGHYGVDYLIRANAEGTSFELQKVTNEGETAGVQSVCKVDSSAKGAELELTIPRKALGLDAVAPSLNFKWTDGLDPLGDWSVYTTDGDAAPNDLYFYRYQAN